MTRIAVTFLWLSLCALGHWDIEFSSTSSPGDISSSSITNADSSLSASASSDEISIVSSTASAEATSPAHVPKNAKRGISFPVVNNPEDFLNINQTSSVISWVYDWSVAPPNHLQDVVTGLEYVPMQWGAGNIASLRSVMESTGAKTLLAFNEPDFDEQSNLDPTYAAEHWMEHIEPLKAKLNVRLGAPAVTGSATGRPWLRSFFAACRQCSIDFLPLHWYGEGTAGFYDYLWSIHGEWPEYKIWITEYADTRNDYDVVLDFLNTTAAYLDELDWVERYAWFGYFRPENDTSSNMLGEDGGLNALGKFYIGAGSVEESGPATHSPGLTQFGTKAVQTALVGTNVATPTFTASASALGRSFIEQKVLLCILGVILSIAMVHLSM